MTFEMMPIVFKNDKLFLLDQRKLPLVEEYLEIKSIQDCHVAILDMVVRGAPCIGFTGIFGLSLYLKQSTTLDINSFKKACDFLISARPTAVNLKYEVDRVFKLVAESFILKKNLEEITLVVQNFGLEQLKISQLKHIAMAEYAAENLISRNTNNKFNFITHCNTGYLACGSLGTALGVISYLNSKNKVNHVFVDETRPYLQGSRLTAYELMKEEIPHSVIVEGAASYIMSNFKIDAIFVGADRIALNGDTANKIGTSTLSIVARHYNVPFYVVAPSSSFDLDIKTGKEIEIEMRSSKEITDFFGNKISHSKCDAINPSFDVTDHQFITAIVCEYGVIDPKVEGQLEDILRRNR